MSVLTYLLIALCAYVFYWLLITRMFVCEGFVLVLLALTINTVYQFCWTFMVFLPACPNNVAFIYLI